MKTMYCSSCQRETGHSRKFGIGTLLAVVFTGGFWLLALPFYALRCKVCGVDNKGTSEKSSFFSDINGSNWYKKWQVWAIIAIPVLGSIGKSVEDKTPKPQPIVNVQKEKKEHDRLEVFNKAQSKGKLKGLYGGVQLEGTTLTFYVTDNWHTLSKDNQEGYVKVLFLDYLNQGKKFKISEKADDYFVDIRHRASNRLLASWNGLTGLSFK